MKVEAVEKTGMGVKAVLQDGRIVSADKLLVSIGRKPNTSGIGLEAPGIETDARTKKIIVDKYMRTNIRNIYAIGDACNSPLDLAHTAMKEGLAAVENIAWREYGNGIPLCSELRFHKS